MSSKRGWHTRQKNRVKRSASHTADQVINRQEREPGSLSAVLSEAAGAKTGTGKIVPLFSETLYRAREIDPL